MTIPFMFSRKFSNVLLSGLLLTFIVSCTKPYDILILNGTLYDGKGGEGIQADLAITDQEIVAIGNLKEKKALRIIDAIDLAVSPGFIDLHAHIESIAKSPAALSALSQGVTTVLGGPDGMSPFPLRAHLDLLETLDLGINVAYLTGHNTIRELVMSLDDRAPTEEELKSMGDKVKEAMEDGAFGISTGLKYLPGAFSTVDEIVYLSKIASRYGGIYTSHLREEGRGLISSVREAIEIGDRANIPVVLTHHKVVGKPSWGNSVRTLAMVDSANAAGLDVQLDQYPYTASFTKLTILIPAWAMEGGQEKFLERVKDPEIKEKIKIGILDNILNDRGAGDIRNVQFSKVTWMPEMENKTLADWAISKGLEPTPENGADLVIEAQVKGGSSMIYHAMDEGDVIRIMKYPGTMIASDGELSVPGEGYPHPRAYGTFPRVLGKYVREKNVLTLEEAIRKMTYLPAQRLGLEDRGVIKKGNMADIVIFDPETVEDRSTFSDPHQYPAGIIYVIVNGVISIDKGKTTNHYNGKILRRQDN